MIPCFGKLATNLSNSLKTSSGIDLKPRTFPNSSNLRYCLFLSRNSFGNLLRLYSSLTFSKCATPSPIGVFALYNDSACA